MATLKETLLQTISNLRNNIYPSISNRNCTKENYDYYAGALDALTQIEQVVNSYVEVQPTVAPADHPVKKEGK